MINDNDDYGKKKPPAYVAGRHIVYFFSFVLVTWVLFDDFN